MQSSSHKPKGNAPIRRRRHLLLYFLLQFLIVQQYDTFSFVATVSGTMQTLGRSPKVTSQSKQYVDVAVVVAVRSLCQ